MEDRGEKIINLAHEMLRNNVIVEPAPAVNAISFKVLCMATCLAAFGGGFVTAVNSESHRPLTHYEKTELEALIFYASRAKGLDEAALRKDIEMRLGIGNIDDMTEGEFQAARRYLQKKAS